MTTNRRVKSYDEKQQYVCTNLANLQLALLVIFFPAMVCSSDDDSAKRPIQDFLSTQGTFCFPDGSGGCLLFVPPVPNYLGWSSTIEQNRFTLVDYAGVANDWIVQNGGTSLGTQADGAVFERPLKDGRAEATVTLHSTNALAWVISGDGKGNYDFANGPLLFGHRAQDVLNGSDPALGSSLLHVAFINASPGAALPDIVELILCPPAGRGDRSLCPDSRLELHFVSFVATAEGTLRANFGVKDGTPGKEQVTQTGVLLSQGKGGPREDFFPAEHIDLQVVGKK